MINRRNIRTKVLHTIFELQLQEEHIDIDHACNRLRKQFSHTESLHTAIWLLVIQICDYVTVYSNTKASKLLPTFEDKNVNTKLAENVVIQQLKNNSRLTACIKEHKLSSLYDIDFVRTLFLKLIESSAYQSYISEQERNPLSEKSIIEEVLKDCIYGNDIALSFLSENYINLETDLEMLASWTDKVLLNASGFSFNKLVSNEKYDFAFDLLKCYYDKKASVLEIIEPKLVNWDADRVAILDLIVLHLGICELLYFESIPVKVTINEYIDLAKSYSGMQSGQFVNGLLDNVRKDLLEQNKIHKIDYKTLKN